MVRPRLDNSITIDNVLRRMVPGQTYTAYALAAKFHVPTAQIRPVLEQLTSRGSLELSRTPAKQTGFVRPVSGDDPVAELIVAPSVATAPVNVRLDGVLTGYDAEIRTRMELAMMARGR